MGRLSLSWKACCDKPAILSTLNATPYTGDCQALFHLLEDYRCNRGAAEAALRFDHSFSQNEIAFLVNVSPIDVAEAPRIDSLEVDNNVLGGLVMRVLALDY